LGQQTGRDGSLALPGHGALETPSNDERLDRVSSSRMQSMCRPDITVLLPRLQTSGRRPPGRHATELYAVRIELLSRRPSSLRAGGGRGAGQPTKGQLSSSPRIISTARLEASRRPAPRQSRAQLATHPSHQTPDTLFSYSLDCPLQRDRAATMRFQVAATVLTAALTGSVAADAQSVLNDAQASASSIASDVSAGASSVVESATASTPSVPLPTFTVGP
jgi:hypothetical protein